MSKVHGFQGQREKKVRTSFQNFPGFKLNTQQQNSNKSTERKKLNMIANGELEAGTKIVLLTYEVLHVQED